MNTVPDTGLTFSALAQHGRRWRRRAAAVVNVWSGPKVVPAELVATSRTW